MTHAPVRSSSRRFASAHDGSTVWGHQTDTEPRPGIQRQKTAAVSVRRDVSDSSKGRRDRITRTLSRDFVLGIGWRAALSLLGWFTGPWTSSRLVAPHCALPGALPRYSCYLRPLFP